MGTRSSSGKTQAPRVSPKQPPIRVLLAEDDHDIREALVQVLESDGCEVLTVSDGSELLEHLGAWLVRQTHDAPADVIVTDVRMPGFDGLSIIDGLRAYGWPLPAVVISAFADRELRSRVGRIASAVFMEKPLDIDKLKLMIRRMAARQRGSSA